mmetsp:Transcript_24000/g.49711  ORF Transcript_24000/g.49711 Transcript_24000/m.49711 type:complete len:120 (+) Transcript_24000:4344-4703(+)
MPTIPAKMKTISMCRKENPLTFLLSRSLSAEEVGAGDEVLALASTFVEGGRRAPPPLNPPRGGRDAWRTSLLVSSTRLRHSSSDDEGGGSIVVESLSPNSNDLHPIHSIDQFGTSQNKK